MPMLRKHHSFNLPTQFGTFSVTGYSTKNITHLALTLNLNALSERGLVRIHSSCLFGESFLSLDCDCGHQLWKSMKLISEEGSGIIIYLEQEGRGAGMKHKLEAMYVEQTKGMDTVEAYSALGLKADMRNYEVAVFILNDLGVRNIRLLTNNPDKVKKLNSAGISATREPLIIEPTEFSIDYLETKRKKLGHQFPLFRE